MKWVCPFRLSVAQVALFVTKAQPQIIRIAALEYRPSHVQLAAFVSGEFLITPPLAGCQALKWAHWPPSLAWKDTFAHPILLLLWEVASAILVITVLKAVRIQFKHHTGHLPVKMEVPLLEVYVSLAPFPHDQDKSNVLPVQREVPVSVTAPTCLAFVLREHIDPKQTPFNLFLANLVQNERFRLIVA